MKTSAILTPTNIAASPTPAAKQSGESSDVMFNQVLSRELAGRKPEEPSKPVAKENNGNRADAPKQPTTQGPKTEKAKTSESAKSSEAADEETDEENVSASAPADLLALVASLAQINKGPAKPVADATAEDEAGKDIALGKDARTTGTDVDSLVGNELASDTDLAKTIDIDTSASKSVPQANTTDIQAATEDFAAAIQSATDLRAAQTADLQATAPVAVAAAPLPLQNIQAAANQPVEKLTPQVGSPGWDQALGQKVVWMAAGAHQTASLTLNPPDLGPLQVVLNVSNNHATANFTAAQPEVRQALETAMPKLREMLSEAGIQLGQANVSAGMPNNQQSAFGEQRKSSRGSGPSDDSSVDTPVRVTRGQTIISGRGLVDTFV